MSALPEGPKYMTLVDHCAGNPRDAACEIQDLRKLLREAVKIIHCHARNTDKDWLLRARAVLREYGK